MALSAGQQGTTSNRILNKLQFAFANEASDVTTGATGDMFPIIDVSANYEVKYADAANVLEVLGITSSAAEANYLDITALGTGAASKAVVLDSGEDYTWPATGVLTYGVLKDPAGTTLGATVAEINAAADVSVRRVAVADANYQMLVVNSGKPHLVANVSADRTFTFPAEADGLEFEFIAQVFAADGHDWIFDTGADVNYFLGSAIFLDTDAGPAGAEVLLAAPDGNSNSKFQINLPSGGTRLRFVCDGTTWTVSGTVVSTTAPAFADQ